MIFTNAFIHAAIQQCKINDTGVWLTGEWFNYAEGWRASFAALLSGQLNATFAVRKNITMMMENLLKNLNQALLASAINQTNVINEFSFERIAACLLHHEDRNFFSRDPFHPFLPISEWFLFLSFSLSLLFFNFLYFPPLFFSIFHLCLQFELRASLLWIVFLLFVIAATIWANTDGNYLVRRNIM